MYYLIRNRNTNELAIWCFTWRTKQLRLVHSFASKTREVNTIRYISRGDKILAKAKHYKDLYFDAAIEELTSIPDKNPALKIKTFSQGVHTVRTYP